MLGFTCDCTLFFFQLQEGMNKQTVAKLVELSQDCGYVGVGWEGKYGINREEHSKMKDQGNFCHRKQQSFSL